MKVRELIWGCIRTTLLLMVVFTLFLPPFLAWGAVAALHQVRSEVEPAIWDTGLTLSGLFVPTLKYGGSPGSPPTGRLPEGFEGSFTADITEEARERAWGLLPAKVARWRPQISRGAARNGLDELMLATIVTMESLGNPNAVSSAGALGLAQVMPFHFDPSQDPFDTQTNLDVGGRVLKNCMVVAGGRFRYAAACYNGGPGALTNPSRYWVAEVAKYFQRSKIYQEILVGDTTTLDNWLGNYQRADGNVPDPGEPADPDDPDSGSRYGLRVCLEPAKKGWKKWVANLMDLLGLGPYHRCKVPSDQNPDSNEDGDEDIIDPGNADLGQRAVAWAKKQLGKRYEWAATGPSSFDCSGLTSSAWKSVGVNIGRTCYSQYLSGRVIGASERPQAGDVVIFETSTKKVDHCGMMTGQGKEFIEATALTNSVRISSLTPGETGYRSDLAFRVKAIVAFDK